MIDRTNGDRQDGAGDQIGYAKRIARKFGLTLAQAQALIMVVGTDLAKLTEAAERLQRKPG